MSVLPFTVRQEAADDACHVESLIAAVFGPGMTTRAAHVLREGVPHVATLSFVAEWQGALVGSVRLTPIWWGAREILMLGPLGVSRSQAGMGIGRALMQASVEAARAEVQETGRGVIFLVGDLPYYAPFGFSTIAPGRIRLPRPADPARVLACELTPGALSLCEGTARNLYG